MAVEENLLAVGKIPFSYNVRNLVVRWRMTLMTALAFTLVIGLLTFMLAFVNGMRKLTEGSGHPENVVVLARYTAINKATGKPLNVRVAHHFTVRGGRIVRFEQFVDTALVRDAMTG